MRELNRSVDLLTGTRGMNVIEWLGGVLISAGLSAITIISFFS